MTKDNSSLTAWVLLRLLVVSDTHDLPHVNPKTKVLSVLADCAVPGGVWLRLVLRLMSTKLSLNQYFTDSFLAQLFLLSSARDS